MSRAETHITLHGQPPTEQIKVDDGVAIVTLTSPSGEVSQTLSGASTRVVDELLSLAGRVAQRVDWDAVDAGQRANVQRNACAVAARSTVAERDESAVAEAVEGERWPTAADVAGEAYAAESADANGGER